MVTNQERFVIKEYEGASTVYKIFCYNLGFKKKPVIWKKTLVVHAMSDWSKPEKVGSNIFFSKLGQPVNWYLLYSV